MRVAGNDMHCCPVASNTGPASGHPVAASISHVPGGLSQPVVEDVVLAEAVLSAPTALMSSTIATTTTDPVPIPFFLSLIQW
jgi:hypothetical protein